MNRINGALIRSPTPTCNKSDSLSAMLTKLLLRSDMDYGQPNSLLQHPCIDLREAEEWNSPIIGTWPLVPFFKRRNTSPETLMSTQCHRGMLSNTALQHPEPWGSWGRLYYPLRALPLQSFLTTSVTWALVMDKSILESTNSSSPMEVVLLGLRSP